MSKFRKEFIEIVNKYRQDPTYIIPDLEEQIKYVDEKKVLRIPGSNCGIQLNDGKAAYEKAISEIKGLKTAVPMKESKGLTIVAKDYLNTLCGYDDPDDFYKEKPDLFNDTLDKYGKFIGSLSNISEFGGDSPKQTFINLLVQDGSPNKSNCKTFCDSRFKEIGLHFKEHPSYSYATFILLATKYTPNSTADSAVIDDEGTTTGSEPTLVKEQIVTQSKPAAAPATASAPAGGDDEELKVVKTETKSKLIKRDGKKIKVTITTETYNDGSTVDSTQEEIIG